jgi:hypothetical protein
MYDLEAPDQVRGAVTAQKENARSGESRVFERAAGREEAAGALFGRLPA